MSGDPAARPARISLVIPAYGEAASLGTLLPRLLAGDHGAELGEIIVVDDHSEDETLALVRSFAARDPRVRGLRLARNSGSHLAILCGLKNVRTDAAVV